MASNLKIDLRQLNSFLTIAKRGSFSRASEALFIAQPALSRQIRLLEEALDAELFVRHGRGVLLTTAGEVLYERAKGLLKDTEQLQADVAAVSGTVTGQVKLGLLPTISNELATMIVKQFRTLYPRVNLAVRSAMSGTLQQMVSQQKLDLVITYDQSKHKNLRHTPLIDERFFLIAPPDTEISKRNTVNLDEVLNLPLILPEEKHGLRARMEKEAMQRHKKIDLAFEVSAWPLLSEMIKQQLGYTILSSATVSEMVERGEIVAVPIVKPELYRSLAIATPGNRPASIAVRKLIEVIFYQVAQHVESGRWSGKLLFEKPVDCKHPCFSCTAG